jgi:flagellar export protein FliJ
VRPFRFRAQPALDLRRQQEDEARQRLGEAERASREAQSRADEARAGKARASDALIVSQTEGSPAWLLGWHRSWMTRQQLEVDARSRDAAVSAATVECAAASVRDAHQRRRTLERLRDRMRHRHTAEAAHHERRNMDLLAGLRYLAHTAEHSEGDTASEHHIRDIGPVDDQSVDDHGQRD